MSWLQILLTIWHETSPDLGVCLMHPGRDMLLQGFLSLGTATEPESLYLWFGRPCLPSSCFLTVPIKPPDSIRNNAAEPLSLSLTYAMRWSFPPEICPGSLAIV